MGLQRLILKLTMTKVPGVRLHNRPKLVSLARLDISPPSELCFSVEWSKEGSESGIKMMRLESRLVGKVAECLDYSEAACENTTSRLDFAIL